MMEGAFRRKHRSRNASVDLGGENNDSSSSFIRNRSKSKDEGQNLKPVAPPVEVEDADSAKKREKRAKQLEDMLMKVRRISKHS